jgi:hypothetical protein
MRFWYLIAAIVRGNTKLTPLFQRWKDIQHREWPFRSGAAVNES